MGSFSSAFKTMVGGGLGFMLGGPTGAAIGAGLASKPGQQAIGSLTGANAAQRASQALANSLQQQQAAAMNLQKNMSADLRNTEVADVQVGGSADAMDALKRRRKAGGLASTLGL